MPKRLTAGQEQDRAFLKEVERMAKDRKKREALRAQGKREAIARIRKGGV